MGSWPKQPEESPLTSPQADASSRAAAPQQGPCSCSSQGVFACGGVPGGRGHGHGQQGQTRPEQVLPLANRKRACDAGGRPLAPDAWDRESLSRQNEMQLRSPEQGSFSVGGCGGGGGSSSSSRLDDAARHFGGGGGGGPLSQGGLGGGLGRPPGHGLAGLSSGEAAAAHEFVASLQSGDGGGMSVALPHGLGGSHSVHEQLRSHLQNAAQRLGGGDGRGGGADEHGDSQPSRRAVSGGPGVGGQWGAAATTLGNGEEVIELDDIFDVRPCPPPPSLTRCARRELHAPPPLPHPSRRRRSKLTTLPDASLHPRRCLTIGTSLSGSPSSSAAGQDPTQDPSRTRAAATTDMAAAEHSLTTVTQRNASTVLLCS